MIPWDPITVFGLGAIVEYGNKLYRSLQAENVGHDPTEEPALWWGQYVDPITRVYNALWSLVENHAPLAFMVKPGNRIKYAGSRDPAKSNKLDADLPELKLVTVSSEPHAYVDSTNSEIVKRFRFLLKTGDRRVDMALFPIEWELFRALARFRPVMDALTEAGSKYVVKVILEQVRDQNINPRDDGPGGPSGWASLAEVSVQMRWNTSLVITN